MKIIDSENDISKGSDDTLDSPTPLFKCTICRINFVDAENGIDTCDMCLLKQ